MTAAQRTELVAADPDQTEKFLSALVNGYTDALRGLRISTWTQTDKVTRQVAADDIAAAVERIHQFADDPTKGSVFFSATLTRRAVSSSQRPNAEQADALLGVWADIDIAGPGHAGKRYPTSEAEVREILTRCGLHTTMIVHTGGGWHCWWCLSEPMIFGDTGEVDDDGRPVIDPQKVAADRKRAGQLTWAWNATLQHRAREAGGWAIDSTFDLARLMRPAGTVNRKIADKPRPVRILECDPTRRADLEDLEAHLVDKTILDSFTPAIEGDPKVIGTNICPPAARPTPRR